MADMSMSDFETSPDAAVIAHPIVAPNPRVLPPEARQHSLRITTALEPAGAPPVTRRLYFRASRCCAMTALRALNPRRPIRAMALGRGLVISWPDGVTGSITQTNGFVSAAVADARHARAVGIDSERILSTQGAREVALAAAWPSELLQAREAGLDRLAGLTLAIAAKETVFKCLAGSVEGTLGFHDVRLVDVEGPARLFRVRIVRTLGPGYPSGLLLNGRFEIDGAWVHAGMLIPADAASPQV